MWLSAKQCQVLVSKTVKYLNLTERSVREFFSTVFIVQEIVNVKLITHES